MGDKIFLYDYVSGIRIYRRTKHIKELESQLKKKGWECIDAEFDLDYISQNMGETIWENPDYVKKETNSKNTFPITKENFVGILNGHSGIVKLIVKI